MTLLKRVSSGKTIREKETNIKEEGCLFILNKKVYGINKNTNR